MGKSADKLKTAVEGASPLTAQAWKAFSSIWQSISVSKMQILSPSGATNPYFYFNLQGILRWVHQLKEGNEITIEFIQEGSFSGYLDAEQRQKRSKFALQALSQGKLLRCSYKDLDSIIHQHPEIELFIRISLGRRMEKLLNHLVMVQCCSSQEKCNKVLEETPELLQLVPQKYIANHLGVHATNFSKHKKPKR